MFSRTLSESSAIHAGSMGFTTRCYCSVTLTLLLLLYQALPFKLWSHLICWNQSTEDEHIFYGSFEKRITHWTMAGVWHFWCFKECWPFVMLWLSIVMVIWSNYSSRHDTEQMNVHNEAAMNAGWRWRDHLRARILTFFFFLSDGLFSIFTCHALYYGDVMTADHYPYLLPRLDRYCIECSRYLEIASRC